MKKEKSISIRIEPYLLEKLRYVAQYEGRSVNGQMIYLVRKCVEEFEIQNHPISVSEENI